MFAGQQVPVAESLGVMSGITEYSSILFYKYTYGRSTFVFVIFIRCQ